MATSINRLSLALINSLYEKRFSFNPLVLTPCLRLLIIALRISIGFSRRVKESVDKFAISQYDKADSTTEFNIA